MTRLTLISLVVTILLGIIACLIPLYLYASDPQPIQHVDSAIWTFGMLAIGLLFTLGLGIYEGHQSADKKLERLEHTHFIERAECVGKSEDATQYILDLMPIISAIQNTHIKPPGAPLDVAGPTHEKFKRAITDLIFARGRIVTDVVSDHYVDFYRDNRMDGRRRLTEKQKYVLKSTSANFPFINYMIVEYETDRPTDVFLGWVYDVRHAANGHVFRISDPDVTKYFQIHFTALLTQASDT